VTSFTPTTHNGSAMGTHGTALISGAYSGMGRSMPIYADRLARRGYDLIVVARREARLRAVLRRMSGDTNRSVQVMAADLADLLSRDDDPSA